MGIQKKLVAVVGILLLAVALISCKKTLTEIKLEGVEDKVLEHGVSFNILEGVKAVGDNGEDYTSRIEFTTTSTAINASGDLDTKSPGEVKVRYQVVVEEVKLQQWRTITVKEPERSGDALIQNGDFSQGRSYWTIDQGVFTDSIDGDALKIEVTAGGEAHQPRLQQMGIPFEKGKAYEISFEAKSSVEKTINLQVGELLASAPWFTDFKFGQVENRKLTTEWASYSYKFTHTIENDRGGILFEFGKVNGEMIDATVWIKNIKATETVAGPDETAPVITGVDNKTITIGTAFDPLTGVKVTDNIDGDISKDVKVVIKNDKDEVVEKIDVNKVGTYTIIYEATDKAGNKSEKERVVIFEDMVFTDGNLIINGDFSSPLGTRWNQFNEAGAASTMAIENSELVIDVTAVGGNAWDVQVFQEGFKLEKGKTYKVSFKVRSAAERTINLAIGVALTQDPWFVEYMPKEADILINTEEKIVSYIFTVANETTDNAKIVFEAGNTSKAVNGKVIIDDVMIQEKLVEPLVVSDFTNEKHSLELSGAAENTVIATRTKDSFKLDIKSVGGEPYVPHYAYVISKLEVGTYNFKIKLNSSVARTLRFNVILPDAGYTSILDGGQIDFTVTASEDKLIDITFEVTEDLTNVKLELDFGPIVKDETHAGVFILSNIELNKK